MVAKIIDLNASSWRSIGDFYSDLLKQVGAPDWHGESVDALIDSMIYGGINEVEPPYIIRIHSTGDLDSKVLHEVEVVSRSLSEARLECLANTGNDRDVTLELS